MMPILLSRLSLCVVAMAFLGGCDFSTSPQEENREPVAESQNCEVTVFSDVRYIAEAGDVVGTEIVLHLCPGSEPVTGQLDVYEGSYSPTTIPLSGALKATTLEMSASQESSNLTLIGQLESDRLRCELRWKSPESVPPETLDLRRVAGRLEDLVRQGRQNEIEYSNQ
jgi:hypothetical protein